MKRGLYRSAEGIREFAIPVMEMFKSVSHDLKNTWEFGETVVFEMEVIYTRSQDEKVFKIPCLDIIQFKGDKVQKLQAFIDASPAFS